MNKKGKKMKSRKDSPTNKKPCVTCETEEGIYEIPALDFRLETPCSIYFSGPTQSGKTTLLFKLLKNRNKIFKGGPFHVIYYCLDKTKEFEKNEDLVDEWIREVPSADSVREKTEMYENSGGSIVVLDDMCDDLEKNITKLFTVYSHHFRITVILINQSLFVRKDWFRRILENITHTVIFKNNKDKRQFTYFAMKFAPTRWKYLQQAYEKYSNTPYSYLWFDSHQTTPAELSVKTKIFEEYPVVILENK